MDIVKSHRRAYGVGVEHADTMVYGALETKLPEYVVRRPLSSNAEGAFQTPLRPGGRGFESGLSASSKLGLLVRRIYLLLGANSH